MRKLSLRELKSPPPGHKPEQELESRVSHHKPVVKTRGLNCLSVPSSGLSSRLSFAELRFELGTPEPSHIQLKITSGPSGDPLLPGFHVCK